MRRIKQYSLSARHWGNFPDHVAVIDMRDYRLLLRVARAAERFRAWDYAGTLSDALDALNRPRKIQ